MAHVMITKEFSRYLKLHEITICKDIKGSGLNIQPLTMLDVDGLLPKRVFETRISRISSNIFRLGTFLSQFTLNTGLG